MVGRTDVEDVMSTTCQIFVYMPEETVDVWRPVDAELVPYVLDLLRVGDFPGKQIRRIAAEPGEQEKDQQHDPEQGRNDLPETADDVA